MRPTASYMKVRKFFPGVRTPLFHATTGPRAASISLRGEGIKAQSGYSDFGGQAGISVSRDLGSLLKGSFGDYIFVLDKADLGRRFQIEPVQHPSAPDEFEERIWTDHIPVSMIRGLIINNHLIRFMVEEQAALPFPVVYKDKKQGWTLAGADPAKVASRYLGAGGSCPVRTEWYGGIESEGGFFKSSSYERGAGRVAEAVHCLLGSLGRHLGGDKDKWETMLQVESDHIREETDIIVRSAKEFALNYVMGEFDLDNYGYRPEFKEEAAKKLQKSLESIRTVAPNLQARVEGLRGRLKANREGMPPEVYEAAWWAYTVLVDLCKALTKSVPKGAEAPTFNAFKDSSYQTATKKLQAAVQKLL